MPSYPINHLRVPLKERSYDIEIGAGNLSRAGLFLASAGTVAHAVVITDENVENLHARPVAKAISDAGISTDFFTLKAGEESKSIETAFTVWEELLAAGTDRQTVIVAVGGGVIGDLAGFVAATFARGVRFFQVPTTLLAQVDSSVGGKVGINLPLSKNAVGAFHQPIGVLIDLDTLQTLDDHQFGCGLGEVLKYGVSLDTTLLNLLETQSDRILLRDTEILQQIVVRCCALKSGIVERDERETTGLRALLNYGHTFAHALETATGYGALLHGQAVAIGMICAAKLAKKLGRVTDEWVSRAIHLNGLLRLPVSLGDIPKYTGQRFDTSPEELVSIMFRDKKTTNGQLQFVLPSDWGKCELVRGIPPEIVAAALL